MTSPFEAQARCRRTRQAIPDVLASSCLETNGSDPRPVSSTISALHPLKRGKQKPITCFQPSKGDRPLRTTFGGFRHCAFRSLEANFGVGAVAKRLLGRRPATAKRYPLLDGIAVSLAVLQQGIPFTIYGPFWMMSIVMSAMLLLYPACRLVRRYCRK